MNCVECSRPVDTRTGYCSPCGLWSLDTSSLHANTYVAAPTPLPTAAFFQVPPPPQARQVPSSAPLSVTQSYRAALSGPKSYPAVTSEPQSYLAAEPEPQSYQAAESEPQSYQTAPA